MAVVRIPLDRFQQEFSSYTEISSVALGASIVSVSDEFFAEASHLLKVEPAPSLKGSFGPNGALYSGWESRRHNPNFDWCIIKLGAQGSVLGLDIDTSHFNGNEAPEASVEGLFSDADVSPTASDKNWNQILPRAPLGPNSRHLFKCSPADSNKTYNYVKLVMHPDGGIARFRVYGLVDAKYPADPSTLMDLAHVFAGGRAVFASDQHFGVGSNLLLPGRGKDMGDGWETKRSRVKGHKDWVIIRLGQSGQLDNVEIDTNHFKGNYPESCEMHACISTKVVPSTDETWDMILPRNKLGPHRRHFFQLENVVNKYFTHVRVTIYPDGGIKRLRVMGRRNPTAEATGPHGSKTNVGQEFSSPSIEVSTMDSDKVSSQREPVSGLTHGPAGSNKGKHITALPLTTEAFIPFGQVLMAWVDPSAAPRGVKVTSANQNTAHKFHNLSHVESVYPREKRARTGFSVYRSTPAGAKLGGEWEVKLLERHPCTNQAFIPMGTSNGIFGEDGLSQPGRAYLVIVALNGEDDRPDLKSLRAFIASSSQGIVYNVGIWRKSPIPLIVDDTYSLCSQIIL
ncbi:Allantoicase [Ramaria rubella]|nr:Allantoicase [Ramaria rubella]